MSAQLGHGGGLVVDAQRVRLSGVDAFETAVSALFAPLRLTDTGPPEFQATVRHTVVGPKVVARLRSSAATVVRDSILSSDQELMHVTLHHRGKATVVQDDRATALKPGELFACDNTRSYRIIGAGPSDMTVLCVPRAHLGPHADIIARRTALGVPAHSGISGLLGHALAEAGVPGEGVARAYLADALISLVLAAFTDTSPERAGVASELVDRIRVYTLANLGDPDLCAEYVAREHHISVRYLHTLFRGADLTFAAWVRRERLLRIRRDLLDPALSGRTTEAIAVRWGVRDTRHLARAMRAVFGETVRELRHRQRHGTR